MQAQATASGKAPGAVREIYLTLHGRAVPAFAEDAYDELLADRQVRAPEELQSVWEDVVQEFMESEAGALIQSVSRKTVAQIQGALQEAMEPDEDGNTPGIEEIARQMEEKVEAINRVRARRIARTEIVRASNLGAMEGARATGLELEKEWIAARDSRTRASHVEADGQTVGMDEAFEVGAYEAAQPAAASLPPAESVNCRCTVGFIPQEDD